MKTLKKLSIVITVLLTLLGTALVADADVRNTNSKDNELRKAQQLNYSKYVKNSIKNNKSTQQWRIGRKKEGFKGDLFLSFR